MQNFETPFESLVNSDRYQTQERVERIQLSLRALLIQIGIKLANWYRSMKSRLRALLIQIGIKHALFFLLHSLCLRALLIQIGIKQRLQVLPH